MAWRAIRKVAEASEEAAEEAAEEATQRASAGVEAA